MKKIGATIIILVLEIIVFNNLYAQSTSDTLNKSTSDSTAILSKSQQKEKSLGIRISKDAPTTPIVSEARDSAIIDVKNNFFFLYGNSKVKQDNLEVKSGVLEFNQKEQTVFAYPTYDTSGKQTSEQSFSQGGEVYNYDTMRYNIRSNRAIVKNARTKYGDGFVISEQIKRNPDQSIYGLHNLYTTCDLPHPHFGIRANRIKVVPGRVIAAGSATLEISDIKTPLLIPFAVFPISVKQRSGFIMPSYTMQNARGLGLQRGGYYFNVNDYLGAIFQFDIFTKGSYGIFTNFQYAKRYQYAGNFQINYTKTKTGEENDPTALIQNDFQVTWSHKMDAKARPGTTFTASVNVGTGKYNRVNGMIASTVLNNQYTSSIAYTKAWDGKPYTLAVSARHNQSTQTGQVQVTLPELTFNVAQFNPFQNKNRVGTPKWYEKITTNYLMSASNQWQFIDSTFSLNNINIKDFDNGIKQSLNIAASYNVLRFFNVSFNIPYNEYWNTKQTFLAYNPTDRRNDTTFNNGFFATRDFKFSTSVSTRIYGMKMFKKGKIAGIRHMITPSVNANLQPGFARSPFNYFYNYYDQYDYKYDYSPYTRSPIGYPTQAIPVGALGFSINNNLQMKVRTDDSVGTKNVTLIDGLSISGNYNFFADSLNLSPISINARTNIANKFSLSGSMQLNPYEYYRGVATGKYLSQVGKGLVDIRSATIGLNFNLAGGDNKSAQQTGNNSAIENAKRTNEEVGLLLADGKISDYYDFNIPWNLSIAASANYNKRSLVTGVDTTYLTPNLTISGGLKFTEKMMVNFTTGYDFNKKEIGYSTFNITRDLHCWQMMLNLIPFGYYRSFNFTINVKASALQDLKLTRRRSYQDNF